MAHVYLGLSGFSYKPWQGEGRLYPPGLKQKEFLAFYADRYDSVEMDGTFYQMPKDPAVQGWLEGTPADFKFCFKAHARVTHNARLKPEAVESMNFLIERVKPLRVAGKLGPFLVQLPPNFKRDDDRLRAFLELLKLPEGVKIAVEFRHESWSDGVVQTILEAHNVAWVASDRDPLKAQRRDTADFCYFRLRRSDYNDDDFKEWAAYIGAQETKGKDCYVFCKHEDEGSPWEWVEALRRHGPWVPPAR